MSQVKDTSAAQLALDHFDFSYQPVYKEAWPSIRLALLSDPKHCALINNLASPRESVARLQDSGASDLLQLLRAEGGGGRAEPRAPPPTPPPVAQREEEGGRCVEDLPRDESGLSEFLPSGEPSPRSLRRAGIWHTPAHSSE